MYLNFADTYLLTSQYGTPGTAAVGRPYEYAVPTAVGTRVIERVLVDRSTSILNTIVPTRSTAVVARYPESSEMSGPH